MAPSRTSDVGTFNGENPQSRPNHIPIIEQPAFTPRKIRIVCAGAGYSGLMLAHYIQNKLQLEDFIDLTIYEKNHEVGGTWLENRYPGCACDSPAHVYTFSWEPNPDWSEFFAGAPEIWQYIRRTTDKYKLDRNVKLHSNVVEAVWSEKVAKWMLAVECRGRRIHDECDIFVNGSGILNQWKWPNIEGLERFQGKLLHTARWDPEYNLEGKKVAVIGNGSTALQVVPKIYKSCTKLVNYIRSPTWVCPNFGADQAKAGGNFKYTDSEKAEFRSNPEKFLAYRKELEHGLNQIVTSILFNREGQKEIRQQFAQLMRERLQFDEALCAELIPTWDVGCRRFSPADGYLESLLEPNVVAELRPIERVTPAGIRTTDGQEEPFDLIICATGFDVSFKPPWKMVGRNDADLARLWDEEDPKAYLSMMVPGFPNYFICNGPNCPIGHGGVLAAMESTVEYICKWAQKVAKEDIKSFEPTTKAVSDLDEYTQEFMKRTVWVSGCNSWYKNTKTGKITALWGGSALHYKEVLEDIRGEDFKVEWMSPNRYRYFGNGTTRREAAGGDLSFYLDSKL